MVLRDGLVVSIAGTALGLVIATAALRPVATLLHGTTTTDPVVYASVAVVVLVASLVASWIPARRAWRADPLEALRSA